MPKLSFVSIKPTAKHTASVIFLHGLGDSGHGFMSVGQMLSPALPNVKWIFPHSPERSITVNGGARMPGWYDIVSLERIDGKEDEAGMLESKSLVQDLIETELDLGIPNTRIILGGFSQGAAITLLTGIGSKIKLGGLAVLSGYLPLGPKLSSWQEVANKDTPIFMAHGSADPVVLYSYGKDSADRLIKSGYAVDFKTYNGMEHSLCNEELADFIRDFIDTFAQMNLFGKAKAAQTTPKDAIIKLRESLEMLEKREKYLEQKIQAELKVAKANATKNKRAALMALKRKKAYEEQINKISGSRLTLETQVMAIENANVNLETMNAMAAGAAAMKSIHGKLNIDKVDSTMDDIRDQMDLANEISDAISQPVGFGVEFDEDELTKELEDLEQEELDAKLLDTGIEMAPSVPLTSVPAIAQAPRPVKQKPEANEIDDELAALQASMAMN